jgi:hypothetical protein
MCWAHDCRNLIALIIMQKGEEEKRTLALNAFHEKAGRGNVQFSNRRGGLQHRERTKHDDAKQTTNRDCP